MKNIKSPRLGLKLFYKMIEKIERVYFTFPIIHLRFNFWPAKIRVQLMFGFLEPLTCNTADPNKLKEIFALSQLLTMLYIVYLLLLHQ